MSDTLDWVAAKKAGTDGPTVFEAVGGQQLDTVRIPEFFTYEGFHQKFIARLGGLAERMKRDRRVLGDAGQQDAVDQQYNELAGNLLDIYTK